MDKVDVLAALNQRIAVLESDGFKETAETWRGVRDAVAALIEAAKQARYSGLPIGADCAGMLAELQKSGIYKPRCSDGAQSNADASRDLRQIEESRDKLREALARVQP